MREIANTEYRPESWHRMRLPAGSRRYLSLGHPFLRQGKPEGGLWKGKSNPRGRPKAAPTMRDWATCRWPLRGGAERRGGPYTSGRRMCILTAGTLYFKARAKSAARKEQCSSHEWSLSSKSRFASGTLVFLFLY